MTFDLLLTAGVVIIGAAIALRYSYTFGHRSLKAVSSDALQRSTDGVIASFICSDSQGGNGGLFITKDRIWCRNQDTVFFDLAVQDIASVEYSKLNFFRIITSDQTAYKICYLHEVPAGQDLFNNLVMTPNLNYQDQAATDRLVGALQSLGITADLRPHTEVMFVPYQGSRPLLMAWAAVVLLGLLTFWLAHSF